MNPTPQPHEPGIRRVRRLVGALVLGAAAVFRPAVWRRLAGAAAAAALLAAGSLLPPQPAAASPAAVYDHYMLVRFDWVKFSQVNDGCCPDTTLEVYGSVAAFTSGYNGGADGGYTQGADGGLTHRNFGSWGEDGCDVAWSNFNAQCSRNITNGTYYGSALRFLCQATSEYACYPWPTNPNVPTNNVIPLRIKVGETLTFKVRMKDHDSSSADDEVCTRSITLGPFTADNIGYATTGANVLTFGNGYNGHAACQVQFTYGLW